MKNDFLTAVIVALIGIFAAYFITNTIVDMRSPGDFSFETVDSSVSGELASPNPEVFNYEALNPTVEVYVGNCTEVNMYGECVDESSSQIEAGIMEEDSNTNSSSSSSSTNNSSTQSNQNQESNQNGSSN